MVRLYSVFVFSATLAAADLDPGVQTVFSARCNSCHGAAAMGKLDLRSAESALKGGASGLAILPGESAKSLLMDKVVTGQMPPGKVKLTAAEMDVVRNWIDKSLKAPVAAVIPAEHEIRGILQARCVACHGADQKKGGLDLRTNASRLKGGKSGPALVAGKPDESLMLKRIVAGTMPPDKGAKELAIELPTDAETQKIRAWIAGGAPDAVQITATPDAVVTDADRKFWSFQSPVRPTVPSSSKGNPIDAFIAQKLKAKGMAYNKPADPLTLLRRAHLDLTGLPPTKAEIDAYLADKAPGAYVRVIDNLLASPRYGERWGQHWLDLAGYADSEGFGQDDGVRRFAWRYRDYVVRSLNADKPYDLFLTEQIAGDEMSDDWKKAKGVATPEMLDRLAATGFLRTTPDPTNSAERGLIAERMNIVADEVEVLASSVMGVTMGCARCHNHKYDPIPQRDYYRLSAVLQGAYDPYEWKSPNKREFDLALASEREAADQHNAPLKIEQDKLKEQVKTLLEPFRQKLLDEKMQALPEAVRNDLKVKDADRSEGQKYLAAKFKTTLEASDQEVHKRFPETVRLTRAQEAELQAIRGKMKPKPHVRVLMDNEQPSQSYLLRRGDPVNFGDPVEPNVPLVLQNPALKPLSIVPPFPGTSGRRLALANWLTQPNHPLTARVAVNQLWMRHFGRGIVASVSNFGRSGVAPSHPELLDWLATEFVQKGWSMKTMHRLMMTSEAYRQSSQVDAKVVAADPDNALVSRMPLRRMDAETLYDSLITAAGRLDLKPYGPADDVAVSDDKEVTIKSTPAGYRRSIYTLRRRQTPVSLMDAFDQPAMTPNCTERRQSNVATQALHMFNGSMTWELSKYMAGRVIDEADGDREKEIDLVYLRAYGRAASVAEKQLGREAIADFRKQWPARLATDGNEAPRAATANWLALANYCHAILNSAEFSFID